ncbi:hypothetical protein AB4228_07305 [Vibrio breoganii]
MNNVSNKTHIFLYVIATIAIIAASLSAENMFPFLMYLALSIIFVISNLNSSSSIRLFTIVFSVYIAYSTIAQYLYFSPNDEVYFISQDSLYFWGEMVNNIYMSDTLYGAFEYINDTAVFELKLYGYIYTTIAYASSLFGDLEIYSQVVFTSFCSALIAVNLYKLLQTMTVRNERVYVFVLIYAFFSFNLFYSALFLRDSLIACLYSFIFLYALRERYTLNTLITLVFLSTLVFYLRPVHGIVAFAMSCISTVRFLKRVDNSIIYIALLVLGLVIVLFFDLDTAISKSNAYLERSVTHASSSSLGVKLLLLPFPINYIVSFLYSQFGIFPFWTYLDDNPFRTIEVLASLSWFVCFYTIVIFIVFSFFTKKFELQLSLFESKCDTRNMLLISMSLLSIIAILGASSEFSVRRLYCFYPILFVLYIDIYNKVELRNLKLIAIFLICAYSILLFLYSVVKL